MVGMFWIATALICLVIEVITLGLTTIWFTAGALAAFVVFNLGLSLWVQIAAFAIVSAILLVLTRPIAMKYLNAKTTKTNAESLVGKTARVLSAINNLKGEGRVLVNGMDWSARSSKDEVTMNTDEIVTIVGIRGVKLIVEKKKEDV